MGLVGSIAAPVALQDWLKMKNPACAAVKREAEEDWGSVRIPAIVQIPLSISHRRLGVAGISMWRNPTRQWRASTIALMTAGGAPTAPASPGRPPPSLPGFRRPLTVRSGPCPGFRYSYPVHRRGA